MKGNSTGLGRAGGARVRDRRLKPALAMISLTLDEVDATLGRCRRLGLRAGGGSLQTRFRAGDLSGVMRWWRTSLQISGRGADLSRCGWGQRTDSPGLDHQ